VKKFIKKVLDYRVRAWMYGVAAATVPLAIAKKWMEPETALYVIPLLIALFKVTPDKPPKQEE
jgi:hypothetical protein